ncbi:MAG: AAA family ATPase [Acholeplasmataceae bacterium]
MKIVTKSSMDEAALKLRLIVYGEPGTGKTWLGASGCLDELTSPTLFVEYRSQISSLKGNPKYVKAIEDGQLLIVSLDKYDELSAVYTWLFRGRGSIAGLDKLMESAGHADDVMPKTVVIDSVTELQRSEVMRRAGNPEGKFLTDVAAPEIRDWNTLLNQFTLLAHLFFDLPYNIVFGGLEDVDYGEHAIGEAPPITGYRLAMQGQAKRQFPAYAMTLMRLDRAPSNSNAFNIGYTRSVKAKTKDQTGVLPDMIPNPTVPLLVKLLNKKLGG